MLVGYGGNLGTLNDDGSGQSGSVVWPTVKLLSRNLVPCKRDTKFYYIDRNQKTFVPDFQVLVEMLRKGEIDVRIKRVFSLNEAPEAHREWTKLKGIGSVVVKIDE